MGILSPYCCVTNNENASFMMLKVEIQGFVCKCRCKVLGDTNNFLFKKCKIYFLLFFITFPDLILRNLSLPLPFLKLGPTPSVLKTFVFLFFFLSFSPLALPMSGLFLKPVCFDSFFALNRLPPSKAFAGSDLLLKRSLSGF